MDCTSIQGSLTLESHAVLQYVNRKTDRYGNYAKGLTYVANALHLAPSEAGEALELLVDAEALNRTIENGVTLYRPEIACVCDGFLLQEKPRAQFRRPLPATALVEAGGVRENTPEGILPTAAPSRNPRRELPDEVEKWGTNDFVNYFIKQIRLETGGWGQINRGALSGRFKAWRQEGMDPIVGKAIIDAFCSDIDRWQQNGQPAWKSFIYNCSRLQHEVAKVVEFEKEKTADETYWSGTSVPLSVRRLRLQHKP